jgi:hypothetical protein
MKPPSALVSRVSSACASIHHDLLALHHDFTGRMRCRGPSVVVDVQRAHQDKAFRAQHFLLSGVLSAPVFLLAKKVMSGPIPTDRTLENMEPNFFMPRQTLDGHGRGAYQMRFRLERSYSSTLEQRHRHQVVGYVCLLPSRPVSP